MTTSSKIVGIGGLPRSGKDSLAELFISDGFYGFSFGDFVRDYTRKRHADKPDPISVANMTETSNWLRDTHGPDVVLKAALEEFGEKQSAGESYKGLVLFSVRAPVEVDFILEHGGDLIWVEASDEVRFERGMKNLREGEARISPQEFKRQEALQWQPQPGIPVEAQMNTEYVKQKATITFENNIDDLEDFKLRAHQLVAQLSQ